MAFESFGWIQTKVVGIGHNDVFLIKQKKLIHPQNILKENPDSKYPQIEQKGNKSDFWVAHEKGNKSDFHPENLALCESEKPWETW